jgi:uncharacterized protein
MFDQNTISIRRFCAQGIVWTGTAPLRDFPRLLTASLSPDAALSYRVEGRRDTQGRDCLQVRIDVQITLECQACLQPALHRMQVDRVLYPVVDGRQMEALEDEFRLFGREELEAIELPDSVDLVELVEDEFLLALPLVPRHEEDDCP